MSMQRFLSQITSNIKYSTAASKLQEWRQRFEINKISEPLHSAEFIISHVFGKKTFSQLSECTRQQALCSSKIKEIDRLCQKRLTHMPIQYVIEEWDFGGLTLKMRPPILIPRPETEALVDQVYSEMKSSMNSKIRLLEVGCGTGAITLALLYLFKTSNLNKEVFCTAIDIDERAVELTKENAQLNTLIGKNLQLQHCDIASFSVTHQYDGIVSNPPYISTTEMKSLQPEISLYESELALNGGKDGLDVVRKILDAAQDLLKPGGWIWMEVDTTQPEKLSGISQKFYLQECKKDYLDRERFVKLVKV